MISNDLQESMRVSKLRNTHSMLYNSLVLVKFTVNCILLIFKVQGVVSRIIQTELFAREIYNTTKCALL